MFLTTHILFKNTERQTPHTVHTEKVIVAVEHSVDENPNESFCHSAQQLELLPSSLWNILQTNLGLRSYNIQVMWYGTFGRGTLKRILTLISFFINKQKKKPKVFVKRSLPLLKINNLVWWPIFLYI